MKTKDRMRPAHVIEIITPKRFVLNGLWFGPKKPKRAIIFIHGLTGSVFSMKHIIDSLLTQHTALVTFNNRGFEQVTEIKRIVAQQSQYVLAGAGHEVFTDCVDDIQGAINFVKKNRVKNIYLAGHSTGCQKAFYWANKNKKERSVKGIILFGPLSDYSIAVKQDRKGRLANSVEYARGLVRARRPHELMPQGLGPWFVCDAQRYLSLYTADSAEEIFPYAQTNKDPKAFKSVRVPTLLLLAGNDEHGDTAAEEIAKWFKTNTQSRKFMSVVVPKVGHGFKGGEKTVAKVVKDFIAAL